MKQKQCHLLLDIKTTIFVEKSYNFTRNSTYINSRVLSVYDLAVRVSWVHLDLHLSTKNDDSLQSCGGSGQLHWVLLKQLSLFPHFTQKGHLFLSITRPPSLLCR